MAFSILGDATSLIAATGESEAALGRLEATGTRASNTIANAFGAAAVAGVIAFGAAIAGTITTAADFEQKISSIGAVAGATSEQMKQISATALQLGKDTSFSASQAAAGMEELLKAGLPIADVLNGGAEAMLNLAAAGGVSVPQAATIMSTAMNTFKADALTAAQTADILAGAANASAIDINDLGFSLASVGPVAATMGVSLHDTATAIAVLGQAGLKGSDAGTSLKTMLLNLSPQTKQASDEMRALGIITGDTSAVTANLTNVLSQSAAGRAKLAELTKNGAVPSETDLYNAVKKINPEIVAGTTSFTAYGVKVGALGDQFFDATGAIKPMPEIFDTLSKAVAGMSKEQEINALKVLFGTDAIRASAIAARLAAGGFDEMSDAMGNVTAADVARVRLDNLKGSMEKLRGSIETGSIMIGSLFLPALKDIVDTTTDVVNSAIPLIGELPDAWRTVGQVFEHDWEPNEVLGPFMNAIGNAAIFVRDTFLPIIQMAWGWIQAHSEPLIGAIAGVGVALAGLASANVATAVVGALGGALAALLTPVGLVVTAGAALGAAWANDFGGIQEKTQDFVGWFWNVAAPAIITAGQTVVAWIGSDLLPAFGAFAEAMQPELQAAWTWLTSTAFPGIVAAGQASADWFLTIAVPAIQAWAQWLQPKITAAWTWFTGTALPGIQAAGAAAWDWITSTAIPQIQAWAQWLQPKLQAAWDWLTGTALPTIVSVGGAAWGWVTGTAVPALQSLAEAMQPSLEAAWTWFTSTAMPAITTAASDVGPAIQAVTGFLTDLNTAASNKGVYDDLATGINNLQAAFALIVGLFTETGPDKDIDATGTAAGTASPLVEALATGLSNVATGFKDITEVAKDVAAMFYGIRDAIIALQNAVRDLAATTLPAWVTTPIPGVGLPIISPNPIAPGPPMPSTGGPVLGPAIPPGFTPGQTAAPAAPAPTPPSATAPAAGSANPPGMPAAYTSEWEQKAFIAAVKANVSDPVQFVEQIREESGLDPNAPPSKAGAIGIAQIVPKWHPGVNASDPQASLDYAAALMARNQVTYGDPNVALAAYNAGPGRVAQYGGVPPFEETNRYISDINARTAAVRAAQAAETGGPVYGPPAPSTAGPAAALPVRPPAPPSQALIPQGVANFEQNQQEWDRQMADANAICGPHLAALFASAVGRPPTRDEAVQVAQQMHIYDPSGTGSGIKNSAEYGQYATALIQSINPGSPFSVQQTPVSSGAEASALAQSSLAGGAPIVGFNTPLHYFGATSYDPSAGTYHVGGTGTSISPAHGGKPDMTIAEMEAYGGSITRVITLEGQFQTANQSAAVSLDAVGAAGSTSTQQIAAIGTAIDPVVASMDEGTTSASQLADAIILSSENQGVAVTSTEAYKGGLIDQQTAMEGVLGAFAATTPAAADLLTQLQAGTISTDDAAVAFAGLSTSTAIATGDLQAMGTDGTAAVDTMATDVTTSGESMKLSLVDATGTMQADGTASLQTLQADGTTAMSTLATDATTSADGMQTGVTTAADGMRADVNAAVDGMQTDVSASTDGMATDAATAAGTMATDVGTAADTMATDATTSADTMGTNVAAAADTMNTTVSGSAATMSTDVSGSADAMVTDVSTALSSLSGPLSDASDGFSGVGSAASDAQGPMSDFAGSLDDVGSAAGDASGPLGDFSDAASNIELPDLSDFASQLKDIAKAADNTKSHLEALSKVKTISGNPSLGKASGGPVYHDSMYIVGEKGPELFVPDVSGTIIPNHRLRGLADGGYVQVPGVASADASVLVLNFLAQIIDGTTLLDADLKAGMAQLDATTAGVTTQLGMSMDLLNATWATISGDLRDLAGRIIGLDDRLGHLPHIDDAVTATAISTAALVTAARSAITPSAPRPPTAAPAVPTAPQPADIGTGSQLGPPVAEPRTPMTGITAPPGVSDPSHGQGVLTALPASGTDAGAPLTAGVLRVQNSNEQKALTQFKGMVSDIVKSATSMSTGVVSQSSHMSDGVTAETKGMAADAVDAAGTMQTDSTAQAAKMNTNVTDSLASMRATGVESVDQLRAQAVDLIGGNAGNSMLNGVTASAGLLDSSLNNASNGSLTLMARNGAVAFEQLASQANTSIGGNAPTSMLVGVGVAAGLLNSALNDPPDGTFYVLANSALKHFGTLASEAPRLARETAKGATGTGGVNGAFDAIIGKVVDNNGVNDSLDSVVDAGTTVANHPLNPNRWVNALKQITSAADDARDAIRKIPSAPSGSSSASAEQSGGSSAQIDTAALVAAMAQAGITADKHYNLTIYTSAQVEPIADDFAMLEARSRSVT
jgi:hypothetical protein